MNREQLLSLFNLDKEDINTHGEASASPCVETFNVINKIFEADEWVSFEGASLEIKKEDVKLEISPNKLIDIFNIHYTKDIERSKGIYKDDTFRDFILKYLDNPVFKNIKDYVNGDKDLSILISTILAKNYIDLITDLKSRNNEYTKYDLKSDTNEIKETLFQSNIRNILNEKHVDNTYTESKDTGVFVNSSTTNEKLASIFNILKSSNKLKRILNLAGSFKKSANGLRKEVFTEVPEEINGICLGNNLSRLTDLEMLSFVSPDLKKLTLAKYANKQLSIKDFHGREPCNKGPIIIVIDESGSMSDEKEVFSKALALTLYKIAKAQSRWCSLIAYSGNRKPRFYHYKGKDEDDTVEILEWMKEFLSHGSDRDVPVVEMPSYYRDMKAPKGKTDLIFITDAFCSLSKSQIDRFNNWKSKNEVKLITLLIRSASGELKNISDRTYEDINIVDEKSKLPNFMKDILTL